jgi:S1-C subfamily serine protease
MDLSLLEKQITDVVERLSPSVVSITSRRWEQGPQLGAGTGVVVDSTGIIVTNHHVIAGADGVRLTLPDGRAPLGEVLGVDPATDLAVIRVDADDLPAAELGDSERLKVGQFAVAIGNALGLPGGPTVSVGVISALGRPLPRADFIAEGMIQTDAHVNPGNSGGPLADLAGRVIGINAAMLPFAQGVGFAIPVNTVKWVVKEIKDKGRVVRPWLGIAAATVTEDIARRFRLPHRQGVLVLEVVTGSPADEAGLLAGDVIVAIDGKPVTAMKNLLSLVTQSAPGSLVDVDFFRFGERQRTTLDIKEAPRRWHVRR